MRIVILAAAVAALAAGPSVAQGTFSPGAHPAGGAHKSPSLGDVYGGLRPSPTPSAPHPSPKSYGSPVDPPGPRTYSPPKPPKGCEGSVFVDACKRGQ